MLKLKILSDLHIDFASFTIPYDGEDILILAGDIGEIADSNEPFEMIDRYMTENNHVHVLMVLGNHDYYGLTIFEAEKRWRTFKGANFHLLINESIVLGGIRFFGATMWTDIKNGEPETVDFCRDYINDFKYIEEFSTGLFRELHRISREALINSIKLSTEPMVVITHHLPSYSSIDKRFAGSLGNAVFASTDLEDIITNPKIHLWIHGHTHSNQDYRLDHVRVICNPRGYVFHRKHENEEFNPNLVINLTTNLV